MCHFMSERPTGELSGNLSGQVRIVLDEYEANMLDSATKPASNHDTLTDFKQRTRFFLPDEYRL